MASHEDVSAGERLVVMLLVKLSKLKLYKSDGLGFCEVHAICEDPSNIVIGL
jgi:hypothetical protein